MTEKALIKRIMRELKAAGAKAIKIHGSIYSEAGTPDIIGCYRGYAFAIEAKVNCGKSSKIQDCRLREWAHAGAITGIAREDFDVDNFLSQVRAER